MERKETDFHLQGCSIAKQTILTTHPSGLQTRVSVELANYDSVGLHRTDVKKPWGESSPFLGRRGLLGGLSAHGTPVLGRRSDAVQEGRRSAQGTPVMRRRVPGSPAASPLSSRRLTDDVADAGDAADDCSVISGWLKFRDNKRWKSRWGVVTKLSPAADCLHLQLYREPRDRLRGGQSKASLSLQQFLGFESGFTLDKESHTLAVLCRDVTVALAFETRERLIAWQVKVGSQLGSSTQFLVLVGAGSAGGAGRSGGVAAGPARLHLRGRRFALAAGAPPRLLGLWEIQHLRRYGVVDGRFCFEGGSHCGTGEGLHVLITEQAREIADAFDQAARGGRTGTSRQSNGNMRPDTRLSDFNTDQSLPDTASGVYEENFFGEDGRGISPFWPSDERREYDEHDCDAKPIWSAADHVTLERCSNCLTKLGVVSRSSTVALSPVTNFNPAWTMEAVPESSSSGNSSKSTEYLTPRALRKTECPCSDRPPQRPPKPFHLEAKKPPAALPFTGCGCGNSDLTNNPKAGPYENYDIPKAIHTEVENGEYYDTPKRIKQSLADDLFQVTKESSPGSLVLKKNCGCILKFGSKKKPVIVECEESLQPAECPCQKVTNWANNLISLPYCKRNNEGDKVRTEVLSESKDQSALYATVDVSRKTNRQSGSISERDNILSLAANDTLTNYENIEPLPKEAVEGPYSNYENLEFALSLEYYENAKDLLKKAGVTQTELDALSANVNMAATLPKKSKLCTKCAHCQKPGQVKKNKSDEYLLMEPTADGSREKCPTIATNPGYTPMSPNPNWSQSLRYPLHRTTHLDVEKSVSNPVLNKTDTKVLSQASPSHSYEDALQKRSSSVDSAKILEDLKEFDNSFSSNAISSSLETLRNMTLDNLRSSPCHQEDSCDNDCCKSDDKDKSSLTDSSKTTPPLRNKLMDNAQIKRSSSVPCKSGGNRDSSSSNDSGVSSCSMKHGGVEFQDYEMPLVSGNLRNQYIMNKKLRGNLVGCIHSSLPRKSKSSDLLRDVPMQIHRGNIPAKSSSAEAEVPVLPPKQIRGVLDTHSTSSGTSDMSDYFETLSLSSSLSSSDTQPNLRIGRQPTSTLRPRSGKEYHNLDPGITSRYKTKDMANYTALP